MPSGLTHASPSTKLLFIVVSLSLSLSLSPSHDLLGHQHSILPISREYTCSSAMKHFCPPVRMAPSRWYAEVRVDNYRPVLSSMYTTYLSFYRHPTCYCTSTYAQPRIAIDRPWSPPMHIDDQCRDSRSPPVTCNLRTTVSQQVTR